MNRCLVVAAVISLVPATAWNGIARAVEPTAAPHVIAIKAGRLFDGRGDASRTNAVVIIEGDRIKTVGPAAEVTIPAGAEVMDLSGATLLPGLIDCHTHMGNRADRYDEIFKFKNTPNHSAFAAVFNARKTLEAGFTTVRNVGSRPFLAVDLRDAIAEGFRGPRIVASGPGISMTGGHGDPNRFAPQVRSLRFRMIGTSKLPMARIKFARWCVHKSNMAST